MVHPYCANLIANFGDRWALRLKCALCVLPFMYMHNRESPKTARQINCTVCCRRSSSKPPQQFSLDRRSNIERRDVVRSICNSWKKKNSKRPLLLLHKGYVSHLSTARLKCQGLQRRWNPWCVFLFILILSVAGKDEVKAPCFTPSVTLLTFCDIDKTSMSLCENIFLRIYTAFPACQLLSLWEKKQNNKLIWQNWHQESILHS